MKNKANYKAVVNSFTVELDQSDIEQINYYASHLSISNDMTCRDAANLLESLITPDEPKKLVKRARRKTDTVEIYKGFFVSIGDVVILVDGATRTVKAFKGISMIETEEGDDIHFDHVAAKVEKKGI